VKPVVAVSIAVHRLEFKEKPENSSSKAQLQSPPVGLGRSWLPQSRAVAGHRIFAAGRADRALADPSLADPGLDHADAAITADIAHTR
jgi:hypothetical protein